MNTSLQNYVSVTLRDNRIAADGEVLFEKAGVSALDFLNATYAHFDINYPKFFKMDNLCKTGFIAAEVLLRGKNVSARYKPEETGIVLSSRNSSLDTDLRYQKSLKEAASPSLFVYTLPNVLIGELCIRHAIKGEAACFVFDIFENTFQQNYLLQLFEAGKLKAAISGWADFYDGKAEAIFIWIEKDIITPAQQ